MFPQLEFQMYQSWLSEEGEGKTRMGLSVTKTLRPQCQ